MKRYYFIIDRKDRYEENVPEDWQRIELSAYYPSRNDALLAARDYSHEHEEFGLYVDWIMESDENGNDTASIPFGDYELRMNGKGTHTWPWPEGYRTGIEYHWDEM